MEECETIKEVVWRLYGNGSRLYESYHKLIKDLGLEEAHLKLKARALDSNKFIGEISNEDLFVKGHKRKSAVRKRVLRDNLISYECSNQECPSLLTPGLWCGQPMVLDLDHIDGDNTNQVLSNLRFLCKNCHSQTPTYGSRNIAEHNKAKIYYCIRCEIEVFRKERVFCAECACKEDKTVEGNPRVKASPLDKTKSKRFLTKEKSNYKPKRKFEVSKEELETMLSQMPMTKIAEMFGVTDNAVRRRAKLLGVDIPKYPPGYWLKIGH